MIVLLICSGTAVTRGQDTAMRSYFPVGTFHKRNANIYGLSVGLISTYMDTPRNVRSNGIRIEPLGIGFGIPMAGPYPYPKSRSEYQKIMVAPLSEQINGISISPGGTICNCTINGISAGVVGQMSRSVNGMSVSMFNFTQRFNGLQVGMLADAYVMNGVQIGFGTRAGTATGQQIGLTNHAEKLKGIQLGLWNVSDKRKFPIINWGF
ncbi:hypothetical protein GCM10028827_42830 [Mucilaginibacter myungsuensis]